MPKTFSADKVVDAAKALTHALTHPHPATPYAHLGSAQRAAIQQLADVFSTLTDPSPLPRVAPPAPVPTPLPMTSPRPTVPVPLPRVELRPTPSVPATPTAARRIPAVSPFPPRRSPRTRGYGRVMAYLVSRNTSTTPHAQANHMHHPKTGKQPEYRHLVQ